MRREPATLGTIAQLRRSWPTFGTAAVTDADDYATAAQGAKADASDVHQITLTGDLALTLPVGHPAGQVYRCAITQDEIGGHTVTYGGQPVTVALAAGASTVVEVWPGGGVVYPGAAGGLEAADLSSTLGLQYRLDNAVESAPLTTASVVVIGSLDGVPYARANTGGGGLYRSTDDGATWQLINNVLAYAIVSTHDGEVIVNSGSLRKSSGWSTDPTTASFTTVLTPIAGGASIIQSNLDSYDNLVIAAEYGNADARYVYLSTDHGATFAPVCDLDAITGNPGLGHWHAVCIDRWHTGPNPRLWASHGDGPRGVYYSDDLGVSWTLYDDTWQPMPLIATPNGIVTGTDQNPDGIFLIPRDLGPKKLLHLVVAPAWQGALIGFGNAAVRDPRDPSRVLITFQGDQQTYFTAGNPARMFVSDGYSAAEVYATKNAATVGVAGATAWISPPAITTSGKVLASYRSTAGEWTITGELRLGGLTKHELDRGRALTGISANRYAVAIGVGASANNRSVVVGDAVVAGTDSMVAVGYGATGKNGSTSIGETARAGISSTAVGSSATAVADQATAVGSSATADGLSTALGKSASATGGQSTALGHSAQSALNGVAIGRQAENSANTGVAIGFQAKVTNGAVALGGNASASGASSIAIGGGGITAAGSTSIAIGNYETRSAGADSVAMGRNAKATHTGSVAIGKDAATSGDGQVAFGAKHIELAELAADTTNAPADKARIYIRDDGAGKTQLCVRFATGAVQVIATEP